QRGLSGTLSVRSAGLEVVVEDILIGDVWLASGQSNMEMTVGAAGGWKTGVVNEKQELQSADYPQLRVFTAAKQTSDQPSDDVQGQWQVCSPEVADSFSAAGYFFARDLIKAGKGPIGLVVSSWGGTRCEAWTRAAGLSNLPEFRLALEALASGSSQELQQQGREKFFAAIDATVPSSRPTNVTLPERWSAAGLADVDGVADYTRTIAVPISFRGQALRLQLGAIDDMDTVYWNGTRVAGSEKDGSWSSPRDYVIAAKHTDVDTVDLCVRVIDTGGEGGFTGKPEQMRLWVKGGSAEAALSLSGPWRRSLRAAMDQLPAWPRSSGGPNRASVLWNGMIEPLLPFPFTGCIWYQGESNRNKAKQYRELFPAMITDWRRAFGREVPFFFVQIAPYGYSRDAGETAELRDAQAVALDLPKTGMVVTLDCGNARDIHPKAKQPVGARLAMLARKHHYGDDVVCSGPRAVAATRSGAIVTLRMEHSDAGVKLMHGGAGFELAGSDGVFHKADAKIEKGQVRVSAAAVAEPQTVRYAWRAVPEWSLINDTGWPGQPFRLAVR
ncbi:MAG: sialate O-acetylesterase, partial [Planctomycetota bacterium]